MQGLDSTASAILKWQLGLACLAAAIFAPYGGDKMLASLSGSAISIAPTLLIYLRARLALKAVGARDPRRYLRLLYRAQAAKFGMTLLLFALVMSHWATYFFQIMAGYLAGAAAYWVVIGRASIRD